MKTMWLRKDLVEPACCNWNPGRKLTYRLLDCGNNRKSFGNNKKSLGNYRWAWTAYVEDTWRRPTLSEYVGSSAEQSKMGRNGRRGPMVDGLCGSHGSSLVLNPDLLHVLEPTGPSGKAQSS